MPADPTMVTTVCRLVIAREVAKTKFVKFRLSTLHSEPQTTGAVIVTQLRLLRPVLPTYCTRRFLLGYRLAGRPSNAQAAGESTALACVRSLVTPSGPLVEVPRGATFTFPRHETPWYLNPPASLSRAAPRGPY